MKLKQEHIEDAIQAIYEMQVYGADPHMEAALDRHAIFFARAMRRVFDLIHRLKGRTGIKRTEEMVVDLLELVEELKVKMATVRAEAGEAAAKEAEERKQDEALKVAERDAEIKRLIGGGA